MSLRYKYIVFNIVLHLALLTLIYYLLKDQLWYFILSEVGVLLSLFFSYKIYLSFIKPINLMQSGIGAIADKDFNIKFLKTGSTEVDQLIGVYNEMIESLRLERTKLSEQSYFIQKLIEVTPLGIIIQDFDGKISNINVAAKNHLEIRNSENVIGKNLNEYRSQLINKLLLVPAGSTQVLTKKEREKYKVQVNEVIHQGFKRKFILIDDLSSELHKTEKEAYGRIIRMMAHEVNNSMGGINSILDTVVEFGFNDDKDKDLKESLLIARKRNVGLSQFMDNYASLLRLPDPVKSHVNLTKLLQKTGQLFTYNAGAKNIEIRYDFPDQEVIVQADAVLLEQAISNIIKNAIEAVENDGTIVISCQDMPKGITIADNGSGISEEAAKQIFTPFFSTKTTGQGVGLMLVREILQAHDAKFDLATNIESGWTEFKIVF